MRVWGVDFTSAPGCGKPITCVECAFDGELLVVGGLEKFPDFGCFEEALQCPGPWIAGFDFPFGQSRKLVENLGWPLHWRDYVRHAHSLGRDGFRRVLTAYRDSRPAGDKEHRRQTDIAAGSLSPQKLYGAPVGLMFLEGAPRLLQAGVTIPHLQDGDPQRIAIEAYPGVAARQIIGRRAYKQDRKKKQTIEQCDARAEIIDRLHDGAARRLYGFRTQLSYVALEDPSGDHLDALLCAIQAAWAWNNRQNGFGAPARVDRLEGWITDPCVTERLVEKEPG